MEDSQKKSLSIRFTKSADYRIIPATGAWGGPTPQGEILCNFYVEYLENPELIKLEIASNGKTKELDRVTKNLYVREQQIGIVLRPDIAKSVGQWLIDHAEKLLRPKHTLSS